MRKLLLAGAILAAGSAFPTTVALGADQHTNLQDFVCHPAIKTSRRVVGVSAVMRPIPGTVRLSMRFQLSGTKSGHVTPVRGEISGGGSRRMTPAWGSSPATSGS